MKVEITPIGSKTSLVLADYKDGFSSYRKRDMFVYEMAHYLHAATLEPLDRGGKSFTISFTVERQHASILAAEIYVNTHANDVPAFGLLTVSAQMPVVRHQPGFTQSFTCEKVVKLSCDGSYKGVQTNFTYEFMGGILK